jgi:TyrR family helix-turn-helix protein
MRMTPSITLPDAEIRALYTTGQSTTALARRYGCSPTTVANRLRSYGITLRPSRFRSIPIPEAALRQLYLVEQLPIAMIAAVFNVSPGTISNRRRRYGIPIRPRRRATVALSDSLQL